MNLEREFGLIKIGTRNKDMLSPVTMFSISSQTKLSFAGHHSWFLRCYKDNVGNDSTPAQIYKFNNVIDSLSKFGQTAKTITINKFYLDIPIVVTTEY